MELIIIKKKRGQDTTTSLRYTVGIVSKLELVRLATGKICN